jgi:hypothetical protein
MRNAYEISVGKPRRRRLLGRSRHILDRMIILKRLLEKHGGKVWTGVIWFRIWTGGGFL